MRNAVAISAMLVGAVLLFWGLGGSWDGDDYAPDLQPRFAAVRVSGWPDRDRAHDGDGVSSRVAHVAQRAADVPSSSEHAERTAAVSGGALTFTSVPGALVFVDDA